MTTLFEYQPELFERFPNLLGGLTYATNIDNQHYPPALAELYASEQAAARERVGKRSLAEFASIAAWRSAFRKFGVEPTQNRNAAEALLRRMQKVGSLPQVNPLADIGNLISIKHALPLAIFDTASAPPPYLAHPASGDERFLPRDEANPQLESPQPGEIIFTDANGNALIRRWCWRQGQAGMIAPETRQVIVTIEAQHVGAQPDIERALADLQSLLTQFTGASCYSAVLFATQMRFEEPN